MGTCTASARRRVILLWDYKVVDMKYSSQGGTKVLSAVEVILSRRGGTCVKIDMACLPFDSLHKNRLSTESFH
jgi:hypothetical protein